MNFLIVTHVLHTKKNHKYFGYAPYINEMNIWIKNVDKLIIIAPLKDYNTTAIHEFYNHDNIKFIQVPEFSFVTLKKSLQSLVIIPLIILKLIIAFAKADHIHLRCPGNMGLLGSIVQIFFPFKSKTVKYAGNWDHNSKQPFSYNLQKKIVSTTFLSKNIKVLVYGKWDNQSKNILPFYTATYKKIEIQNLNIKELKGNLKFIFVGSLTKGKQPNYAIEIIEKLNKLGITCQLEIYGSGAERDNLSKIINDRNLINHVFLKGLANREEIKEVYKKSHFILLPSKSEGWPKVLAEAMLWGCLPISSSVSCIPYMLDNGNRGIVLKNNFAYDISQIVSVLSNQELYNDKVNQAYKWSSQFTLDKFEEDIVKIVNYND